MFGEGLSLMNFIRRVLGYLIRLDVVGSAGVWACVWNLRCFLLRRKALRAPKSVEAVAH